MRARRLSAPSILRYSETAGMLLVTVADDGGGIDLARVRLACEPDAPGRRL